MSEHLEHEEGLPKMNLLVNGEQTVEANPENAVLFRHIGRLAMYDHVFITTETEGDKHIGMYVFAEFMRETFDGMSSHMLDNGYPCFVNKREVPDCDIDAFNKVFEQHMGGVGDFLPDDWS